MRTADFDFHLPPALIAQTPAPRRDASRLLVLHRDSGQIEHRQFPDLLNYLRPNDVLVFNDSRVIPARLRGANARTSGRFEVLLLEETAPNEWWAMLRPGKRARVGTQIVINDPRGQPSAAHATVIEKNQEGHCRLRFAGTPNIAQSLDELGEVPLPPYINRADSRQMETDRERYQTVFARFAGSVAAPTAGLHFTETLLEEIRSRGVRVCFVTLHVGLGTFAPVKTSTLTAHTMHEEHYVVSEETVRIINEAKRAGRRVITVGTTTLRVLESLASSPHPDGKLATPTLQHSNTPPALLPGRSRTRLFIYPPYNFKIADALLTNFHLPRSTLLMLVSAFAAPNEARGRELILSAYAEAVRRRYRFFSYGDAMLIL
jgi:S-adenosylmethionine:tRNA ribosyltransferase-isomerase